MPLSQVCDLNSLNSSCIIYKALLATPLLNSPTTLIVVTFGITLLYFFANQE
jgi:hypothetical protein